MSYYVMSSKFDAFKNPAIAKYDEGKWVISGVPPEDFSGKVMDLTKLVNSEGEPWTNEQCIPLIDQMRTEPPTGKLVIISEGLGQYLYANHPAFMPETGAE